VAVHGLGGLGHLAVQFASRMGFRTIAVARGADKRPLAGQLGAAEYVDAAQGSAGQTLARMGGARLILATAPSAAAIEDIMAASAPVASSCWSRPYPSRSGCNRCP
jgi:propanol-preferring alcohol dehydrogenase